MLGSPIDPMKRATGQLSVSRISAVWSPQRPFLHEITISWVRTNDQSQEPLDIEGLENYPHNTSDRSSFSTMHMGKDAIK